MPRQERTKSGTGIYHVMLRGVNKQDIFDGGYAKASVASATTDKFAKSISDSDVKAFLQMSQGIANPLMVQSLEKTRRNEVLRYALSFGAGVRQLSRLTGVSFGVVQKLTK
jgi:hypothetical protein